MDLNDVVSCTSLGGINIRMLGFVIQVIIVYNIVYNHLDYKPEHPNINSTK